MHNTDQTSGIKCSVASFRAPPCPNGNDVHSLQGLNVQTGLCNYIILHAVYLFSLENEPLLSSNNGEYILITVKNSTT